MHARTARQGKARQGKGKAGHGTARQDIARHGTARHGTARHGTARHGKQRQGTARRGQAWPGTVRPAGRSMARHSTARHGKARHSTACRQQYTQCYIPALHPVCFFRARCCYIVPLASFRAHFAFLHASSHFDLALKLQPLLHDLVTCPFRRWLVSFPGSTGKCNKPSGKCTMRKLRLSRCPQPRTFMAERAIFS
jgi:hypothetical protein